MYDDAADVQAKSGARFEVIYFGETFEHPFLLVGRDADARIGDGDHQLSFFFVDVAGQCDCSAFCKLGGVGGFQSVDQLLEVRGIGEGILARISPYVTVTP